MAAIEGAIAFWSLITELRAVALPFIGWKLSLLEQTLGWSLCTIRHLCRMY